MRQLPPARRGLRQRGDRRSDPLRLNFFSEKVEIPN
ncbi:hypothetical protein OF001_U140063 [Pseudomonas sp. OF001]|nr:hypothetical protein OF001_U140063 [Pseudomonas sp. OF001]